MARRRSWGKSSGPWLYWRPLRSRRELNGYIGGIRLALDQQTGIALNVALVGLGSLLVGWYPNHGKSGCVTGFGVVLEPGEVVEPVHHCFARRFDAEWSVPEFEKTRRRP